MAIGQLSEAVEAGYRHGRERRALNGEALSRWQSPRLVDAFCRAWRRGMREWPVLEQRVLELTGEDP